MRHLYENEIICKNDKLCENSFLNRGQVNKYLFSDFLKYIDKNDKIYSINKSTEYIFIFRHFRKYQKYL